MSNSNLSGQDTNVLINNLTTIVNNLQSSFYNVQTSLSSMSTYDTTNTGLISELFDKIRQQTGQITSLQGDDLSVATRLDNLEAKFPISSNLILNESIDQNKIINLIADLSSINTCLVSLQS